MGPSWRRLGVLLGASWGLLGRSSNLSANLVRFWLPKGCQKGAKREAKWHQNGTQNGTKSKTNFDIEKKPLQDRLGVVLGRSLVIFGRPWGSFLLIFHWFLQLRVKIYFFQKISLQEPSWTELGPTWIDLGTQNGANMAPQSHPNTIKKHVNF